ncbi:hypothetical protein ASZ90_012922 [hydrocarbon metagenome]|uniref:Uncharacterized protein n=1 Tax=hydrocarbon metagenome TaxID=938273 RepID=A0A0W8F938_9ZZZZ
MASVPLRFYSPMPPGTASCFSSSKSTAETLNSPQRTVVLCALCASAVLFS